MADSFVVVGSGGHARAVIALLRQNDLSISGIYDDGYVPGRGELILNHGVLGKIDDLPDGKSIVLAIGDNVLRERLYQRLSGRVYRGLIAARSSEIDPSACLGESNLLFPQAYIGAAVKLGSNNIINTGAVIEHEAVIGSHCHIALNASLCGRVKLGDGCFVGAGAVVIQQCDIAPGVTIGAGSVVTKSISEPGVYVGSPVRKVK